MSPFPGVSEDGGVAGCSAPEGTVLTGDAADGHPNLVPFPGSTEDGTVVGGSQEGTILTGDGVNASAGMVAFPAAGEDQQPGGFVPGEAGAVGTTLDTSTEAPQLGGLPAEDLNIPGATAPAGPGEVVPGIGNESPVGSAASEDAADTRHFGGSFVGGFGESPHAGGHYEVPGNGQGGSYEGGAQNFYSEAPLVAATFPSAPEGTALRTVGDGVIEASSPDGGNTLWYNSAYFQEPDAPHTVMQSANGVDWYAMQQQADIPQFEAGDAAAAYNQATFQNFMPGYELPVSRVDGAQRQDDHFEVRHDDGSGTKFYDTARYAAPRGDYQVYEDARGSQWYAIRGEASVERKPVYENGKPVYDDGKLRTVMQPESTSLLLLFLLWVRFPIFGVVRVKQVGTMNGIPLSWLPLQAPVPPEQSVPSVWTALVLQTGPIKLLWV